MRIQIYFMLLLSGILTLQSCKKSAGEFTVPVKNPLVRNLGTPVAGKPSAKETIGIQGGKLVSSDGLLTLEVPPGAVENSINFEIQEVSSTLEGNNRPSYKITPEGVNFVKPVELKFRYTNLELKGTIAEMLAPAYQDGKGVFHTPKTFSNDVPSKTITVATKHFSAWTLYDRYRLLGPDEVGTGGNVRIKLMTYPELFALSQTEPTLEQWDEALVDNPVSGHDPRLKNAEWKLQGGGGLNPEGLKAVYGAPNELPAVNPVMVSVSMTGKFEQNGPATAKYTLLHPITVTSDEYYTATIDGVRHNVSQATFVKLGDTFVLTGLIDDKRLITLNVNANGKGIFTFGQKTDPGKADLSLAYDNSNSQFVVSVRSACADHEPSFVFSPGVINITAFPQGPGENLVGTVTGAVLFQQSNYCASGISKNVSLSFSVRTY